MATKTQTQDPTPVEVDVAKLTKLATKPLTASEQTEVEQTFAESKDFRSLGEKITTGSLQRNHQQ